MYKKLLIAFCVLSLSLTVQAANAKKIKKTVVTEETDATGKTIKKTETTIMDKDSEDEPEEKDSDAKEFDANAIVVPPGLKTINESWYTLWGLGLSKGTYSGDLGNAFEDLDGLPGADRVLGLSYDILGFYWPLEGHKTMLGVILNGTSDSVEQGVESISLSSHLLAFSAHHFFGANIGDGFFLRGDVGIAGVSVDTDDGAISHHKSSNTSFGAMFGAGYGFPLGNQTRLLVGLYYRLIPEVKIDDITYNSNPVSKVKGSVTSVSVGVLF